MEDGSCCRYLTSSNAVGFCLLPSELIQDILFRLSLPEIIRLKPVSKTLTSVISSDDFRRDFNTTKSTSDTWIFVYKKRSPRDSVLQCFTDRSERWFRISVADYLSPVVPPGEDLYFLTASGDFFLFALNNCREVIAVNLALKTVKRIPPSPLGPRDTSSWRRPGLKLVAGPSGSFRFMFAESYENRPVLFDYNSTTDTWRLVEGKETQGGLTRGGGNVVYLSLFHRRSESVVLAVLPPGSNNADDDEVLILRPRLNGGGIEDNRLAIGFNTGGAVDRLHVYGDGFMAIVRSEGVESAATSGGVRRVQVMNSVEVWGMSVDGRCWEFVSRVPSALVERARKAYRVMMGCLEDRDGTIRVVLVCNNLEGLWDLVWFSYDMGRDVWKWVPLPQSRMHGFNMGGVALSSGLTL